MLKAVPPSAIEVCRRLHENGHGAWLVGGGVRDLLRGAPVTEWDIATSARPEQVQRIFRRVVPTGIEHGTVTVLISKAQGEDAASYEVTTLRGETSYSDGRRPDSVVYVDDIVADLARRDFTVNAIAWDPLTGMLIDPFDGKKDLENRVIRAVGDPHLRFSEDGLRVLRAARFAATLEFEIEPSTLKAIRPTLSTYQKVSAERVRDEWSKAFKAARPSRAFEVMLQQGMLEITAPELVAMHGCDQNKYHRYDVWTHTMHCLDAVPKDLWVVRLAALLHDVGKAQSRAWNADTSDWSFWNHEKIGANLASHILSRLRFSNEIRAQVTHLIAQHLVVYSSDWSDAAVRRWMARVGLDSIDSLLALATADRRGKDIDAPISSDPFGELRARVKKEIDSRAAFCLGDLAIKGNDLIGELSLPPSKTIGILLQKLLEDVLEDPSRNERDRLLLRAREHLKALDK